MSLLSRRVKVGYGTRKVTICCGNVSNFCDHNTCCDRQAQEHCSAACHKHYAEQCTMQDPMHEYLEWGGIAVSLLGKRVSVKYSTRKVMMCCGSISIVHSPMLCTCADVSIKRSD